MNGSALPAENTHRAITLYNLFWHR